MNTTRVPGLAAALLPLVVLVALLVGSAASVGLSGELLVAVLLVSVFFVTSADSGSLVIDTIASGGADDTPR